MTTTPDATRRDRSTGPNAAVGALEGANGAGPSAPSALGPSPRRSRRHPIIRIMLVLLWLGCVPVVAALAAAFALPMDAGNTSPAWLEVSWVAFMVRTFAFHAVGGLLVAGALALALRAPRLAVLTLGAAGLTAIVSGAGPVGVPATRQPAPAASAGGSADAPGPTRLTVMTSNLWRGLTDISRIIEEIERHDPDVIVFQEYMHAHDAPMRAALAAEYPFIEADPQRDFSGMATYSRLPMRRVSGRLLGPRGIAPVDPLHWERQLCCEVQIGEGDAARAVIIQNIHLPTAPMGPSLLAHHRRLVREIRDWLASETRPVVCAGDFNATPMSAECAAIRAAGLVDAHRAAGAGLGTTWGGSLAWPGFRIDHVYSRGLRPVSCRVGAEIGSDHRPVVAVLELE